MSKLFFYLCCLMLATSNVAAYASDNETEIVLFEVVGAGSIIGDEPFDNPEKGSTHPTRPNDFRATISGRTLSVSVDNENLTQVIVRNSAGSAVINSFFYGFTAEQIATAGSYTIEIQNSGMTLIGQFNVQ